MRWLSASRTLGRRLCGAALAGCVTIAGVAAGAAGCDETVLSETVCGGILDPNEVVEWVDRTKRLLRFRV